MKKWQDEITKEDIENSGYHQSILNIMYNSWVVDHESFSYEEMIHNFRSNYGDLAAFAVLVGKYNQQVCNGGHYQYFMNGYAGKDKNQCISLHRDLINLSPSELLDEPDLFQNTIIQKVYTILKKFRVVLDTDRYVIEEYWDESSGEYIEDEVENPNFGEVENYHELNALDTEYYEVFDQFMIILENFFELKYKEG